MGSEVWNMSPIGINCSKQLGGIWQVHTSWCLTQCTGLPEVESLVSLFVSHCMYDVRWIMKDWIVVVCWNRNPIYENIYCFENSLAYPSFCVVVCFVFKTAMIVYLTREQRIWQVVWVPVNCDEEASFLFYL